MLGRSELISILCPDQTDSEKFSAASIPFDSPAIFGGQLLAQVLCAADATLEVKCPAHALQANFMAFGDPQKSLEFVVTRMRDGKHTFSRSVEVCQNNKVLLVAFISFQKSMGGFSHQTKMPDVEQPELLLLNKKNCFTFTSNGGDSFPFQMLNCPTEAGNLQALAGTWVKPKMPVSTQYLHHQMLFAFISDAAILQSALKPHSLTYGEPGLVMATMNHTIWFYRPMNMSEWTLFYSESPNTFSGRALSIANTFNQGGELLATVAQEGILRQT